MLVFVLCYITALHHDFRTHNQYFRAHSRRIQRCTAICSRLATGVIIDDSHAHNPDGWTNLEHAAKHAVSLIGTTTKQLKSNRSQSTNEATMEERSRASCVLTTVSSGTALAIVSRSPAVVSTSRARRRVIHSSAIEQRGGFVFQKRPLLRPHSLLPQEDPALESGGGHGAGTGALRRWPAAGTLRFTHTPARMPR